MVGSAPQAIETRGTFVGGGQMMGGGVREREHLYMFTHTHTHTYTHTHRHTHSHIQ